MVGHSLCAFAFATSQIALAEPTPNVPVLTVEPSPVPQRDIRGFAHEDHRPVENVVYRKMDGKELKMLMLRPDNWKPGAACPAMVWIHGGAWCAGDAEGFLPQARYSAARGAVAFSLEYRLMNSPAFKEDRHKSPEENRLAKEASHKAFMEGASMRDCIDDCEAAIAMLRRRSDELGIDPNRIVVIGDSAGAHLAACLGTMAPPESQVRAVVACSSISDLTTGLNCDFVKPDLTLSEPQREEDRRRRARELSPLFQIKKNEVSWLILQGGADWLKDEPERFFQALGAAKLDAERIVYPDARHAFVVYGYTATDEQITRALLDMDDFLVRRGILSGPTSLVLPVQTKGRPENQPAKNPGGFDLK